MRGELRMNDEQWQAIVGSDAAYDGQFYYGVVTTGIYCRPSCRSRIPVRENVRILSSCEQALAENFRPCKRCRPDGRKLPNEEWVAQITQVIETRYSESLTLSKLAELFHGSPYHLQRTFKLIKGITPAEYILQTRMARAKEMLADPDKAVMEVAAAVGIPNAAHFSTVFQKRTGVAPTHYRTAMSGRE
jgi:AraC family transcriptional regulator, regulatory protein of adaptative response / methylphosphotriester-DNA alkyltransferase methyltransferase